MDYIERVKAVGMQPIDAGLKWQGEVWAKREDLASAIGNKGVDVVSSPATIGYLEMACVHAVEHLFDEGEASVGVGFNMRHVGAATMALPITTEVELTGIDGNMLTFRVQATQAGRPIMTGEHTRAVIELARLLAKLNKPA
jgi:fluoroacetyl-CoA thioesterase